MLVSPLGDYVTIYVAHAAINQHSARMQPFLKRDKAGALVPDAAAIPEPCDPDSFTRLGTSNVSVALGVRCGHHCTVADRQLQH